MISTLVSVILLLIVCGVILWAVQQLLPMVPMPEPFAKIVNVLIVVLVVIIVVYIIAGLLGAVTPLHRL
jgi:preprotein translocase subunit SecE